MCVGVVCGQVSLVQKFALSARQGALSRAQVILPQKPIKSKDSAMLCGVQKIFCVFCMASSRPLNLCLERTSDLGKESIHLFTLKMTYF